METFDCFLCWVQWLQEIGVEMTPADQNDVTPLHLAAVKGHIDIVEFLLNNGCGTEYRDVTGDTALHWAATKVRLGATLHPPEDLKMWGSQQMCWG